MVSGMTARRARELVEAEREACAKRAEAMSDHVEGHPISDVTDKAWDIAAAIRARGKA